MLERELLVSLIVSFSLNVLTQGLSISILKQLLTRYNIFQLDTYKEKI